MHAVRREQGLPCRVTAGQRPGVGAHQRVSPGRGADGQGDHREVPVGRVGEHGAHPGQVAQGLEHEADDPGVVLLQRVAEVVGGGGRQLLARGDRQGVLQAAVGPQQRREDRSRVGHERDRPRRQLVPLEVAEGAHARRPVDEAHAARPADLQPVGRGGQLLAQAVGGAEHHRAPVATGRRQRDLGGEHPVRHAEQHEVDGVGHLGQGRHARAAQHGVPAGIDQPGPGDPGAALRLGRHPPPERARPVAGADHRDGAGLQHPTQPRADRRQHHLDHPLIRRPHGTD